MRKGYIFFPSNTLMKGEDLLFLKAQKSYWFVLSMVKKNFVNVSPFSKFFGFNWFRVVLFSGLGYKKRFFKKYKIMFAYVGDRH